MTRLRALVVAAVLAATVSLAVAPTEPAEAHTVDPWPICAWVAAATIDNPWVLKDAFNYWYGLAHMTHCRVEVFWGPGGPSIGHWCNEYRHQDGWTGNWVRCPTKTGP